MEQRQARVLMKEDEAGKVNPEYTQAVLAGLEAVSAEETELSNCLVFSRPEYKDTGKKPKWVCRVHAQSCLFQREMDTLFLASASNTIAILARRKSLKPGDRVLLSGVVREETITLASGERQTHNYIALTRLLKRLPKTNG